MNRDLSATRFPGPDALAAARSLIRRHRHAEALTILERLYDDDRLGREAIDSAIGSVWRVHGVEAALRYWIERLGFRRPMVRHRRPLPLRHPRSAARRETDRVRLVIVSSNWNFLNDELAALSQSSQFEVRTVRPGWYVTDRAIRGGRGRGSPKLADAGAGHAAAFRWADVVFCDWCERPAIWLADCLPPSTALCVRLHSYEAHSPFPVLLDWRRVHEAIFVADHIREYVDREVNVSGQVRTRILPPVHRVADFDRAKRPEARWTLGMMGYNSRNKHPLLALEILARLRQVDQRWRLRLIGHGFGKAHRSDSDPTYARAFRTAVASLGLGESVVVSPFTTDVAGWLTRVGFILSTSEREGTHEAVAQGMSSGAIPVVRRWPVFRSMSAAERRYPSALHFDDAEEAAAAVSQLVRSADAGAGITALGRAYAREARRRFDCAVGIPRFEAVLRRAAGLADRRR